MHGGRDQAVYAYASEDTAFWSDVVGRELGPAAFGENLTLAGVDVSGARIGERWRIGTTELRVAGPRMPCFKLEARMGDPASSGRSCTPGAPAPTSRSRSEGVLEAGDAVEIVHRPEHTVTVALVIEALLLDRSAAVRARARPTRHAAEARRLVRRAPGGVTTHQGEP